MQAANVHLHRVSADGLRVVIREVTLMARRRAGIIGEAPAARLRSVVEFLLRPALVQVEQLAAAGSAYTDPPARPVRPRVNCPACGGLLHLTPKKSGFIYPSHKVSAHGGRCETSGRPAALPT